jgi:hypothetical protein
MLQLHLVLTHAFAPLSDHSYNCLTLHSYDDNDGASAPAPAAATTAPAPKVEAPVVPVTTHQVDDLAQYDHYVPTGDENGQNGDYNENEEAYDDDDDVDFNLGNGSSHNVTQKQEENAATPSFHHAAKGSSSKEDG